MKINKFLEIHEDYDLTVKQKQNIKTGKKTLKLKIVVFIRKLINIIVH